MTVEDDFFAGKIKMYELDEKIGKRKATDLRRKFIEKKLGIKLDKIGSYTIDPENVIGRNIENMIGAVQIPLGIAGPIKVNGKHAVGEYYLPLATTEGALVASLNRGCSTISEAGGAHVVLISDRQTRGPCFKTKDAKGAKRLADWVTENFDNIKKKTEEGSRHLKLKGIRTFIIGNNVFVRFEAETGDAMGMNMITIGAENACNFIAEETGADYITVSANVCTDKKPSTMNLMSGRGKSVIADVILPEGLVKDRLKTTPEEFVEVNTRKNLLGGIISGSIGFNAHAANVFKALFKATGQDLGHVVEGSLGITWAEKRGDDLYLSVTLPCVNVGIVGGGTRVETAQECLKILNVKSANEFAEVVAAAVLAGELSLISAQAAHHLARAHKKMGR